MAEYGAYSQTATYSVNEIRKLVNYANQRGGHIYIFISLNLFQHINRSPNHSRV